MDWRVLASTLIVALLSGCIESAEDQGLVPESGPSDPQEAPAVFLDYDADTDNIVCVPQVTGPPDTCLALVWGARSGTNEVDVGNATALRVEGTVTWDALTPATERLVARLAVLHDEGSITYFNELERVAGASPLVASFDRIELPPQAERFIIEMESESRTPPPYRTMIDAGQPFHLNATVRIVA